MVYARHVVDQTLTFGVSGMLFRDALVMFDRETDTLWSHVDGRAVKGRLAGQVLEAVPAVHATWAEWKAMYPASRVLKKRGEYRSAYDDYNRNPNRLGIFGRRNQDTRLPGKERILGIRTDEAAVAFPLKAVRQAGVVNARVGRLPVVLAAPDEHLPVVAYVRRVDDRVLTLAPDADAAAGDEHMLRDRETGTAWRLADGVAVQGPLEGKRPGAGRGASRLLVWLARVLPALGRVEPGPGRDGQGRGEVTHTSACSVLRGTRKERSSVLVNGTVNRLCAVEARPLTTIEHWRHHHEVRSSLPCHVSGPGSHWIDGGGPGPTDAGGHVGRHQVLPRRP
ncbi:MAG: DUF3179 domain-containing protein [Luteitalea sp.]|nr:DUF3179 domain-containing protein [Luteitalea sp.]